MLSRIFLLLMLFNTSGITAQHHGALMLANSKFSTGNNDAWKENNFDDSKWSEIKTGEVWQSQGFADYHGYAWYRIHVKIPSSLKSSGDWKDSLRIFLAHVNDAD